MEFVELTTRNIVDSRISENTESGFHKFNFVHNTERTSDKIKCKVRKKCGEIFIDENDLFNFLCTLCEASFEEINNFFVHVKGIHNNRCTTIKQEDPLGPSDDDDDSKAAKHEPNVQITTIDGAEVKLPEYSEETVDSLNTYSNVNSDEEVSKESINEEEKLPYNTRRRTLKNESRHDSEFEPEDDEVEDKGESSKKDPTFDVNYEIATTKPEKFTKRCRIKPVCHVCGKSFSSLKGLRRHRKDVNCSLNKLAKSTICETCGKNFSSKRSLQKHQNSRTCGHIPKIDKADKTGVKVTYGTSSSDPTKCRYCDRHLADSSKRVEHERIHTGEKPYQCQICGKCFRTLALCTTHEQLHTTERLFKCEVCNAAFKSKGTLYTHSQRHGEKKFPCSYCEKSFYHRSERKEHERFHTGEKPFKCIICERAFQTSSSLQVHKRKHLNIRPHKCEYCGNCFFTKAMLRNHIVVHTGERPFACTVCNATFARKKGLSSHEKTHSDLRKHICKTCGDGFKEYSGLDCHMRSHGVTLASQLNSKITI